MSPAERASVSDGLPAERQAVADRDVTLVLDEARSVQVLAGTAVPAALVDAYRAAVADDKPAAKRGRTK